MPDSDLPEGTAEDTVLDLDQATDAIADLLDDSDENRDGEDQAQENQAEDPEANADGDEADADNADAVDEADGTGSDPVSKGRFVSGDAKFRLEDGTVISVADLARNNLYQRDYTRKTTELSEEKKTFDTERQQVNQFAHTLNQQRDFLLQAAQKLLPQRPDRSMMDSDFIGYHQAMEAYNEQMAILGQLQGLQQQEQARQRQESESAQTKRINEEANKIVQTMPELAKPANYQKFWDSTIEMMTEYGFSPQELAGAIDHRFFPIYRDLLRLRKARQAAPKVKEAVKGKPVMQAGKRMDPKARTTREMQQRAQKLRQTGSARDAEAALMDLDL